MTDIWTVFLKELKEYFARRGFTRRGGWTSYLIYLAVFGVMFPLMGGPGGIETGTTALIISWLPFLLVMNVIADSFAGERERGTLETLLATRLSDSSILYGKVAASVVYGLGVSLASLAAAAAVVNLFGGADHVVMYPPVMIVAVLAGGPLAALISASAGVLISLRASTVRQAQQALSLIIILLFLPLALLPNLMDFVTAQGVAIPDVLPAGTEVNEWAVLGGVLGFALLLDAVLLTLARARFRRSRLILD
jgi:ABC-2 type transport system permease protein